MMNIEQPLKNDSHGLLQFSVYWFRLIPVTIFQNYGDAEGEETKPAILYKEIFIYLLTKDETTEFDTNALLVLMDPGCVQNL